MKCRRTGEEKKKKKEGEGESLFLSHLEGTLFIEGPRALVIGGVDVAQHHVLELPRAQTGHAHGVIGQHCHGTRTCKSLAVVNVRGLNEGVVVAADRQRWFQGACMHFQTRVVSEDHAWARGKVEEKENVAEVERRRERVRKEKKEDYLGRK